MFAVTSTGVPQQTIVTLDLEGVLVPEIWIAVAERTGIEALRRTTRDEPDYDVLMRGRLAILDELRARTQVIILSDTFEQFGAPLMRHLGMPTILCHQLLVDGDRIAGYHLRMSDQKRHAVTALRGLHYRVIAAGDSYNDSAMLQAADVGFWFHAPATIREQFPQFSAS